MQKFYAFFIAGLAAIVGYSSCNVINPAEVVPTYVHIDSFSFTGTDTLGSSSHKITNVYVYFDNVPVGIFDLPVTFPVIATHPGTLTAIPGIDFDGLTGYEVDYPLYLADTMHLTPVPGSTINHIPATRYNSFVVARIREEGFESGAGSPNSFTKRSGDTSIVNITTPSEVFEGKGSGLIYLPAGKDSAIVISTGGYIPPGRAAYIELNYKGNMPLVVGMRALLADGSAYEEYLIALKPRADWGKIYVGIREFVGDHQGTLYQVLLGTSRPSGVTDGYLYVDNVKVLSF